MSRILSGLTELLAPLFDVEEGRVEVTDLLDREGVHLVYDLGNVINPGSYVVATRVFDTGALNQSAQDAQTITGLPPVFQVLGILVAAEAGLQARLSSVRIFASIGDADGGAVSRSDFWWAWNNGGTAFTNGAGAGHLEVGQWGAAANTILTPDVVNYPLRKGTAFPEAQGSPQRRGVTTINIQTITGAFGAGTVRVSGHLVLGLSQIVGQRRGVFTPPMGG